MFGTLGFEYVGQALRPALVAGVAAAGLYGLIAVSVVLSYRISRTVAFLHGGITLSGTLMYWWLSAPPNQSVADHPHLPTGVGLTLVVIGGALVAGAYGAVVTSKRMSTYPRVMVTTFSLSIMLILVGLLFTGLPAQGQQAPSPFGTRTFQMFDTVLTMHQVMTLVILVVVVTLLSVGLKWTKAGVYVRAIADNVEASRLVGVPLSRVGTGVYALTGAIAALGGALLTPMIGTDSYGVLFIFLRALIVSVLGAFKSVTLALGGAVLLGVVDSVFRAGVFGSVSSGAREIAVIGLMFGAVVAISRMSSQGSELLQAEGM